MRRALILASLLGLLASGCVGLVQIGKGPLQVGQPEGVAHARGEQVKRYLIAASLLGILAACSNFALFSPSAVQTKDAPAPTVSPSPSPSPTPGATPSPTPESCRIDFMVLQPRDGITLLAGDQAHLSLTPYQQVTGPDGSIGQRETSPACALPRAGSILWTSSPPVLNIGTGFEPTVTRVGVGTAQVTATLEGKVSNAVVIR